MTSPAFVRTSLSQSLAAPAPSTPPKPEQPKAVPRVAVDVPRHAFSPEWAARPIVSERVGIRLVGQKTYEYARGEAARRAWDLHPQDSDEANRIDAFNDALMSVVLARATCQPDDIGAPWLELAEDNLPLALTSDGVKLLWEAFDRLRVASDMLTPPASSDDLSRLAEKLRSASTWDGVGPAEYLRLRRTLRHVLDCLEA